MMHVGDPHHLSVGTLDRERPGSANGDPPIGAGGLFVDAATAPSAPSATGTQKQTEPDAAATDTILRLRSAMSEMRSEAALARVLAQVAEKVARQEISELRAQLASMQAKIIKVSTPVVIGREAAVPHDPAQRQHALQGELDALRRSTSWRLTAPLRAVVSAFRGTGVRSQVPSAGNE